MPARSGTRIHRKAINTPGHAHELTFSCYQRFPFLKAERTCQWLADADWKWSSAAALEGGSSPILLDPIPWDWLADA
jgi:hypothetical protein